MSFDDNGSIERTLLIVGSWLITGYVWDAYNYWPLTTVCLILSTTVTYPRIKMIGFVLKPQIDKVKKDIDDIKQEIHKGSNKHE